MGFPRNDILNAGYAVRELPIYYPIKTATTTKPGIGNIHTVHGTTKVGVHALLNTSIFRIAISLKGPVGLSSNYTAAT